MITVTEPAAAALQRLMQDNKLENVNLRVFIQGECGCGKKNFGMGFDPEVGEEDQVITSAGIGVVVDARAAEALEGAIIEYVDDGVRRGFRIAGVSSGGG
jgi:iron-sulfur cluster assembly protein